LNYTDWLLVEYPHLKNASSVETFSYIKKAKSSSNYWRNIAGVVTLLAQILLLNVLFSFLGVQPFDNALYWLSFGLVAYVSSLISNLLEQKIIKSKLRSIVESKHGMQSN
jgi:hypothetical protein